jgi:hypothetical protein
MRPYAPEDRIPWRWRSVPGDFRSPLRFDHRDLIARIGRTPQCPEARPTTDAIDVRDETGGLEILDRALFIPVDKVESQGVECRKPSRSIDRGHDVVHRIPATRPRGDRGKPLAHPEAAGLTPQLPRYQVHQLVTKRRTHGVVRDEKCHARVRHGPSPGRAASKRHHLLSRSDEVQAHVDLGIRLTEQLEVYRDRALDRVTNRWQQRLGRRPDERGKRRAGRHRRAPMRSSDRSRLLLGRHGVPRFSVATFASERARTDGARVEYDQRPATPRDVRPHALELITEPPPRQRGRLTAPNVDVLSAAT